jgi:hypothetical protein
MSENNGVAATLKIFSSQMTTNPAIVTRTPSFIEVLTQEALSKSLKLVLGSWGSTDTDTTDIN